MNRIDIASPLAEKADYVLEIKQPDGGIRRVCIAVSMRRHNSLFRALESLALDGIIARGGGSRMHRADFETSRPDDPWVEMDAGQTHPSNYPTYPTDEVLHDPFADYLPPPRSSCPSRRLDQITEMFGGRFQDEGTGRPQNQPEQSGGAE